MQVTEHGLRERYRQLNTHTLLELRRDGELTELARSILEDELRRRQVVRDSYQDGADESFTPSGGKKELGRRIKVLLGFLSCWPIALLIFMLFVFFVPSASAYLRYVIPYIDYIKLLLNVLGIATFGLLVGYHVYVVRDDMIPTNKKVLWIIALFVGNVFVMPFFWYHHIWRREAVHDF